MSLLEIAVLSLGTACLLVFNWFFSIKAGRFHGAYRFFSFEAIFLLLLLNWRFWFAEPLSWSQVLSWMLLFGSVPIAEEGFRLLHRHGESEGQFENTTKLVSVGIYRRIRHPLYASLILLGFGVCLKHLSPVSVGLALLNLAAMIATSKTEEKEMIRAFGGEYKEYMKTTSMFFPYVL